MSTARLVWYHGCTMFAWNRIKDEQQLWGVRWMDLTNAKWAEHVAGLEAIGEPIPPHTVHRGRDLVTYELDRVTYLATHAEYAVPMDGQRNVLLKVHYDPLANPTKNNYIPGDIWQIRVYEPISIENVERIE